MASSARTQLSLARDADRLDVILREVDGCEHVAGRGPRHVVLGRLAAEKYDQMDAVIGHEGSVVASDRLPS